jgi:hypothetical protein
MTDTPDFIAQKQFEIVMRKSVAQRLSLTDAMIRQSRRLAISRIKKAWPNCTEQELKYLIIKEYYAEDLGPERLHDLQISLLGSSLQLL